MENKRRIIIGVLALVLVTGGLFFLKQHRSYSATGTGLPLNPDYNFVPVYTLDESQAYLNATVTPLVFVDRTDKSAEYVKQIQNKLSKIQPVSPVVMVSTYFHVPVVKKAKKETMEFIKDNKLTIPAVMQAGDAAAYAPQVPCFVYYTTEQGKIKRHILTRVPTVDELAAATKGKVMSEEQKGEEQKGKEKQQSTKPGQ